MLVLVKGKYINDCFDDKNRNSTCDYWIKPQLLSATFNFNNF